MKALQATSPRQEGRAKAFGPARSTGESSASQNSFYRGSSHHHAGQDARELRHCPSDFDSPHDASVQDRLRSLGLRWAGERGNAFARLQLWGKLATGVAERPTQSLPASEYIQSAWCHWLGLWDALDRWEVEFTCEEGAVMFSLYATLDQAGIPFCQSFRDWMAQLRATARFEGSMIEGA